MSYPPQLPINDIKFMDPLFKPYFQKNLYRANPQYPLVDQKRYENRHNLVFRSKHEGYCPTGWMMDDVKYPGQSMCVPYSPESWGTFYTAKSTNPDPLLYANNKTPYNEYVDSKYTRFKVDPPYKS